MRNLFIRSALILAVLLLAAPLAINAQSPNSHWGGQFGQLVSKDARPTRLYAGSATFPVDRLPAPFPTIFGMFDEGEATLMYAGQASAADTRELYGARLMGEQDIGVWGGLYATIGWGVWAFVNTEGGDQAYDAYALQIGYNAGAWDIQFGGDWIPQDGGGWKDDRFWLYAGVLKDFGS